MILYSTKVRPQAQAQEVKAKLSIFAAVYNWIAALWHRSHIGHRSEYSVERLLAFRDNYQRTSLLRAIAVCIISPIPAVVVTLLIDSIPLKSPSEGWQANYAFWIRYFLATATVTVGAVAQVQEQILPGTISNCGAIVIALGTAATDISVAMFVAAMWAFPIPFGYIIMVGPYMVLGWVFTLLVIGRRLLVESPVLRQQLQAQAIILFAKGLWRWRIRRLPQYVITYRGPSQRYLSLCCHFSRRSPRLSLRWQRKVSMNSLDRRWFSRWMFSTFLRGNLHADVEIDRHYGLHYCVRQFSRSSCTA